LTYNISVYLLLSTSIGKAELGYSYFSPLASAKGYSPAGANQHLQ